MVNRLDIIIWHLVYRGFSLRVPSFTLFVRVPLFKDITILGFRSISLSYTYSLALLAPTYNPLGSP